MKRSAILVLCLVAAFATTAIAQRDTFQILTAVKTTSTKDDSSEGRPRVVGARSAAVNIGSLERSAFNLLNQKRAENGLKALAWSDELEALARRHSEDMADYKYFSHQGRDGSMVSDRADRSGLTKWRSIGENIAFNRGYKDPIEVAVKLWLESPSHRHNLLNSEWRESAVGIAVAEDGSYYLTQVFLLRK